MYRYFWLSLLLLPVLYSPLRAQSCDLRMEGTVRDEETREELSYAKVWIPALGQGVICDLAGNYVLNGLCPGEYRIRVEHVGCEPLEFTLNLTENLHRDLTLPHHQHDADTVHIEEKRPEDRVTQGSTTLTGRELSLVQGRSLGDALRGLGLASITTGASITKPIIQGLHSNRILVLNNGIRQEGQNWGMEHAPEIDPWLATQLTVIKGAAGVRFGPEAIGGVILVEPAPLRDSLGVGGALNLAGYTNGRQGNVSGMVEGRHAFLPALGWRVQGTFRRGGNMHTPDYFLGNTGLKETNFSGALEWKKRSYGVETFYSQFRTQLGIFSGSHIGNLTDLQAALNASRPPGADTVPFRYDIGRPRQEVLHELTKVHAWLAMGSRHHLHLLYARQYNLREEYDKHRPRNDSLSALDLPELHYEITTHQAELRWEHRWLKRMQGNLGVQGSTQANTYEGRFFIPNFRNYNGGIFLTQRWKTLHWELEAGARYDYRWQQIFMWRGNAIVSPVKEWKNLTATTGALYRYDEHLLLRVNASTAWRAPAVNELYSDGLHHGAASIERGDSNLLPEKAWALSLSGEYDPHKRFAADFTLYARQIQDYIFLQPELPPTLTIRGAFPSFYYRQADAVFAGADLRAGYRLLPTLTLNAAAWVVRARNRDTDDYLFLIPPDRFEQSLLWEGRDFKGKVRNSFFRVRCMEVLRQTRVPRDADYAAAPAGYWLLGADAGFTLQTGRFPMEISLSADNLLNRRYRDYLNRFRYFADETGRNLSLRLRIPFDSHTFSKQ